jgi:hypothetical protein
LKNQFPRTTFAFGLYESLYFIKNPTQPQSILKNAKVRIFD